MSFTGISRRQALTGIAVLSATLPCTRSRLFAAAPKAASPRPEPAKPFSALFGAPARGRIQLERSSYDVGQQTLLWNLSNTWVKGAPGGSRIRGSARTLLNLQSSHDCVFEDIVFEVTANAPAGSSYHGVVRAADAMLRNHRFVRCSFIVRQANQNAIKIIAEKGNAHVEGLHFEDCVIDGAGRMGIELQNHGPDNAERLVDFRWQGGAVRNTGLISGAGMGISLSGTGTDHVVDTLFENNRYAALENVGSSNSRFSGCSRSQTRAKTFPVSFTNTRPMRNNVIADFVCLDRASGGCRIWNQVDLTMRDNRFIVSDAVDFRGIANLRSSGDSYDSSGPLVMTVDQYPASGRATEGNLWDTLTLDGRHGPAGARSPVRFSGSTTRDNVLRNVSIWKGQAGEGRTVANALGKAGGGRGNVLSGTVSINGRRM